MISLQEKCCGMTGPDDWKMNNYINLTNQDLLPCSCFNNSCSGVAGEEFPFFGVQTGNYSNFSYQEVHVTIYEYTWYDICYMFICTICCMNSPRGLNSV